MRSGFASDRPTVDLSAYPAVMRKRHVAEVLGISVRSIELQLVAGTFPIPRLRHLAKPRWSKARVQQFLQQDTFEAPTPRPAPRPSSVPGQTGRPTL
jgi:hypothetical protein